MKNSPIVLLSLLWFSFSIFAEMPMESLDYKSMGVSYTYEMTGFITEEGTTSATMLHLGGFHYAPVPYLMTILKFGAADATTVGNGLVTSGDYGFAFQGGLALYTPLFANILKVTGGSYFTAFQSDDEDDGYFISRNVRSNLGLRIDAKRFINFELGAKYNYIFGKSTLPQFSGVDIKTEAPLFVYLQFTLHHPNNGAFLSLNGDFSPNSFTTDDHGVYNGALSLQIGTVLSHTRRPDYN